MLRTIVANHSVVEMFLWGDIQTTSKKTKLIQQIRNNFLMIK